MALHEWGTMTWVETGELAAGGDPVALIPIGSTEQHGPHLPLLTDALFAQSLARGVAEQLAADVLVAPVIHVALSSHHTAFPGTITIDEQTFEAVVIAHIEAARRIGINRIALFSGHGGNFKSLGEIVARYAKGAPDCRVIAYSDLVRFLEVMTEAGKKAGVDAPETDVHAGALETAYALSIFPELVRDYSDVGGFVEATPNWLDKLLAKGARSLSENGVFGLPPLATLEAGHQVMADVIAELTDWVSRELDVPTEDKQ